MNRTQTILFVTHLNVSLYAMCFWIQIGTLPYLTKKLGVNPITFGYLQTTFAAVQLLGGPIYGRFGDLFGSKYALMLAYLSSFTSYFLLGAARSIPMIFLSRLPSVFMHAMHGSQMVITDLSDFHSRSEKLGKLGLSYGIGMVIGPVVGGLCTKYASEQTAAFVAATGSLVSFALVCCYIPISTKIVGSSNKAEEIKPGGPMQEEEVPNKRNLFDVGEIIRITIFNIAARRLLILKILSGIPVGVLHSMFSVLALNHFHLSPEMNGYVLSYVGILSMISQGYIVGRVSRMGLNDWTIIKYSVVGLCVSYAILLTLVTGVMSFCMAMAPMVVAGALFTTVMSGMLTKSVLPKDTGTMLGIGLATNSLIRIIAPTLGGILFEKYGFSSFGVLGILFNAPLAIYLQKRGKT